MVAFAGVGEVGAPWYLGLRMNYDILLYFPLH